MAYFEFENSPSKETPISAENLKAMQKGLMELVFPIGSIYITQSNTNPNSILEFGTWERVKGKVLVGLDEADTNFNSIGKTGGEKTHTLTTNEIPSHSHNIGRTGSASGSGYSGFYQTSNTAETFSTGTTGNGRPHNNLQPYQVIGYMWRRTA